MMPWKSRFKILAAALFACTAFGIMGAGVWYAMKSPIFLVDAVELSGFPERPTGQVPVRAETVHDLAQVGIGRENLFDLDLKAIEERIMTNSWIRSVALRKSFPRTLQMKIELRDPHAVYQDKHGRLSYVDSDGTLFGNLDLEIEHDLTVLSGGTSGLTNDQRQAALKILDAWSTSKLSSYSPLSSLFWSQESGYRAVLVYPLKREGAASRTLVHFYSAEELEIEPLEKVVNYLARRMIAASRIWVAGSKKIVVRAATDS